MERVKELRKAGKRPIVLLTPGQQIRKQKSQEPHRKYPPGYDYRQSYVGRRGLDRPRCLAKRCIKTLRVFQPAVCSEFCRNAIINEAILRLKLCEVTREQLHELYT